MSQQSGDDQQPQQSSSQANVPEFNYYEFCIKKLKPTLTLHFRSLFETRTSLDAVAGHGGILSSHPSQCLKPLNPPCLRSRREHLFYQLVDYFQTHSDTNLRYRNFPLFLHPDRMCDCLIDPETFRTIYKFMAEYAHTKHLITEGLDFDRDEMKRHQHYRAIYSTRNWCPCYGTDVVAKHACSLTYDQVDFICMEDLTSHCRASCVLDIKMGRITYDPMANQQKINEQTLKYPRLRDFGFRLLGMKTVYVHKDKDFGKKLASQEQVFEAIESFFDPLEVCDRKRAVISKMLDILERLLEWFETKNNNQLRFYASSLLLVYDVGLCRSNDPPQTICEALANSVRVRMIDFAHVFHSHELQAGPSRSGSSSSIRTSESLNKDDNYLYGLRRLVKFFIMLDRQQRVLIQRAAEEALRQNPLAQPP